MFTTVFRRPIAGLFSGSMWPWYLDEGRISLANCLAAYKPIGCASLAESYINLAHPGTNDAAPVVAPTLDWLRGWLFTGTQYLNTGIVPGNDYSMIVQFSDGSGSSTIMVGCRTSGNNGWFMGPRGTATQRRYAYGTRVDVLGQLVYGNMAICGNSGGYYNGVKECDLLGTCTTTYPTWIGCNNGAGIPGVYWIGSLSSMAIYDIDIAANVASLAAKMASMAALEALNTNFLYSSTIGI